MFQASWKMTEHDHPAHCANNGMFIVKIQLQDSPSFSLVSAPDMDNVCTLIRWGSDNGPSEAANRFARRSKRI